MINEFKTFIARGNVLDLAVAVVIGAAFGKITTSLTEDIIMPVIGWLFGGLDFSNYFIRLGDVPASYTGSPDNYQALKAAGVALLGYGELITVVINFLLIAFVIFLLVRAVNRVLDRQEAVKDDPADVVLLKQIRDELRGQRGAPPATGPMPPVG